MYPENDSNFEDKIIKEVKKATSGWSITFIDGLSFYVPQESTVEPKPEMAARLYGKGLGFPVRGLFLDEQKVFYRTEEDDKEYREVELYGASATDWLRRWDAGKSVWSIEMGGLGPAYEQCIHITAAEILRHMLAKAYVPELWAEKEKWEHDREEIETMLHENKTITELGLSGAQWGAALNLAAMLFRKGPRMVITDERVKDRHIQVQKFFPQSKSE